MQQKRYQVQIEEAGRRVLGPEKFAQLKNMAGGSLAQRQKDLVAQRQIEMAEEVARAVVFGWCSVGFGRFWWVLR